PAAEAAVSRPFTGSCRAASSLAHKTSTSTRKAPISSGIIAPEVTSSSTISLRRVSMPWFARVPRHASQFPSQQQVLRMTAARGFGGGRGMEDREGLASLFPFTERGACHPERRRREGSAFRPTSRSRYRSGTSKASTTVVTMLVMPTTASTGVHDLKVSSSVTPPIFENSQNPLSFIHVPTSDPLAIAVATYTE